MPKTKKVIIHFINGASITFRNIDFYEQANDISVKDEDGKVIFYKDNIAGFFKSEE